MNQRRDIRADLEPGTPDEIVHFGEHLLECRPLPSPSFRGELRRRLEAGADRLHAPGFIRARIARFAGAGALLMVLGTVSAAGVGPLG